MIIKIAAGAAALAAANTHKDAEELAPLDIDGALLVFDFGPDANVETATESIRNMDAFLGGKIADADEPNEIAALTALKKFVIGVETDVLREFAYIMNREQTAEAIVPEQESQLHSEQHTAINDSSQSNDALDSNDEELNEHGTTQQSRKRKRSS